MPGPERKSERKTQESKWTSGRSNHGRKTMCTSDLGENPATDEALGIRTVPFLPLVLLFSTTDSDSELSSMLLSAVIIRRFLFNPLNRESQRTLTRNKRSKEKNKHGFQGFLQPLGSGAQNNFYAPPKDLHSSSCSYLHMLNN